MPAYIAPARRAVLFATIALVAACSSSETVAPESKPPVGKPPVDQPADTSVVTPAPAVTSIRLSGDQEVVHTYMGWLQAQPLDQSGQPIAANVTWRSSDTTVLKVDVVGAMIGRQPGKAVITAQANGKSAQVEVTVVPRRVTTFQRTNPPATLQRGDIGYFGTIALDQRGQLIHYPQLAFTSSDPSIVEVNQYGHLKAVRGGQVTVTATADGVSTSHVVKVAAETVYPIKYANGNALPWVLMESSTRQGDALVTTRLVMTDASITLSNVSDAWSQRTVVDEYRIETIGGNTVTTKVATHVSTSSGSFTLDAASGRLYLTTAGSNDAPMQAWYEDGNVRKLRLMKPYGNGDNGFLNDYWR